MVYVVWPLFFSRAETYVLPLPLLSMLEPFAPANSPFSMSAWTQGPELEQGIYVAGSVLAALGGLMEAGRVSAVTGQQGYGEGLIFSVFAAAVIGGSASGEGAAT